MKFYKILFAFVVLFLAKVGNTFAESENPILGGTPCMAGTRCNDGTEEPFRTSIIDVINYLLTFVGLVAVIIFIYAGFLLLTGGGKDDQIEKGKKYMIWAAIGIVVILFSYVFVEFIVRAALGL